jgi:hypothetical protein
MWKFLKCRLFRGHDFQLRRDPGALFLQCTHCGQRSEGWQLPEPRLKRSREPLRLLFAETESAAQSAHTIVCVAALLTPGELRLTLAGSPDAEPLVHSGGGQIRALA